MQQQFEEVKIKLLMQIVPVVVSMMEAMNDIMASGDGIEVAIIALLAPLAGILGNFDALVNMERDKKIPDIEDPATSLFTRGFNRGDERLVPKE